MTEVVCFLLIANASGIHSLGETSSLLPVEPSPGECRKTGYNSKDAKIRLRVIWTELDVSNFLACVTRIFSLFATRISRSQSKMRTSSHQMLKTRISFRCFAGLIPYLAIALSVTSQTPATVLQLQEFLVSKRAAKISDADLADRLCSVTLSQQLTSKTLSRLLSNHTIGPKAAEQLELLAATSIFDSPPLSELPQSPAPDSNAQKEILASAAHFVAFTLHGLPDFLATRVTTNFANTPPSTQHKDLKAKVAMHWVRESRHEIAYRNGREIDDSSPSAATGANPFPATASLTTWGEFGPILKSVLDDSFMGTVHWNRWQISESNVKVAVFRFAIPQSSSHYLVEFCCYRKSQDDAEEYTFRRRSAYHGELYVDPATGVIDRITLEAELTEDDPVTASAIAVQYGQVNIGGKDYICPIQSVGITQFHSRAIESIDKFGLEEHVNIVHFLNYHKFGSTSRIVPQ
jgi:hypothetical protein